MVDRIQGILGSVGIKAPVLVATDAPITLFGEQTIDGVAAIDGNRVLVKDQADPIQNGIYDVKVSDWARSKDCDGGNDIRHGTLVHVTDGTAGAGLYRCTGVEPIIVGTSEQDWTLLAIAPAPASGLSNPVTIAQGGHGGITAEGGLSALGVVQVTGEAGTANAQTGDVHALVAAYRVDQLFVFTPSITNTGPTTLVLTPDGASALAVKNIFISGSALVGGELVAGVPVLLQYDGSRFNLLGRTQPLNPTSVIQNLGLEVTISANALIIAVKDEAGNDPSPASPLRISFRSATLTSGLQVTREIIAASSLTVSPGSTLGTTSGGNHRLYIVGIDDGGTFRVGVYNPLEPGNGDLVGVEESVLYNAVAEGGAGAADAVQTIYANATVTAKAIRLLGYFEINEPVAGTWDAAPTKVQVMGPGVHRTNDIVQETNIFNGTVATGTTVIPLDDTIPQVTEGDVYIANNITPTSLFNILRHRCDATLSHSAGTQMIMALFEIGTANAIGSSVGICSTLAGKYSVDAHEYVPGVGFRQYRMRAGSPTAGTTTFNGAGGAQYFATRLNSYYRITEVFA